MPERYNVQVAPRVAMAFWLAVAACGDNRVPDRVLLFSRTIGYRHDDSIALGTQVLTDRLAGEHILVDATEDPTVFTPANLDGYRAVIFFYTEGNDLLDADGKAALEAFVRGGGGWLGIHSAADTERDWPFMQQMLITRFDSHPMIQPAIVDVVDRDHPATQHLPPGRWPATDEWYNFEHNPRAVDGVRILATIDESSYDGGTMGPYHPMIWCHELLGGRVLYSQLGHVADRWHEPAFVDLVDGEVRWVLAR
jgi:type 1 glutamine amidotransferase